MTINIQDLARYMSKSENFAYVNNAENDIEKRKRIDELKAKFLSGNFSSATANFSNSGYCEDNGNESGIYDDCQTFADFNTKAKQETAFQRIKSLVANSNVASSVKKYALQRNEIILRNRAKKAEKDKLAKDRFVSHPSY